jgi:ParB family transcriptional regulator, chromosome partitioning protein
VADVATRTIEQLPIDQVHPAPDNPRGDDLGDLTELAASMHPHGVLQALLVCPRPNGYLVVYGHRRRAAALKAGLTTIPAEVRDLDDTTRRELMLIENLHRDDLTPLQEARGYRDALDNNSQLTQRQLAERVGKSQGHISKRLALLRLPTPLLKQLDSGGISVADATTLIPLAEHPDRIAEARSAARDGLTLEAAVRAQVAALRQEAHRASVAEDLAARGIQVAAEDWWRAGKRLGDGPNDVTVDPDLHAAEPCHRAVIPVQGDVFYICAEPHRHTSTPTADDPSPHSAAPMAGGEGEVQVTLAQDRDDQRLRQEALSQAEDQRAAAMRALLSSQLSRPWALEHVARQLVRTVAGEGGGDLACALLGLAPEQDSGDPRTVEEALLDFAEQNPDTLAKAALAITFELDELLLRGQADFDHPAVAGHYHLLQGIGYRPVEVEQHGLEVAAPPA